MNREKNRRDVNYFEPKTAKRFWNGNFTTDVMYKLATNEHFQSNLSKIGKFSTDFASFENSKRMYRYIRAQRKVLDVRIDTNTIFIRFVSILLFGSVLFTEKPVSLLLSTLLCLNVFLNRQKNETFMFQPEWILLWFYVYFCRLSLLLLPSIFIVIASTNIHRGKQAL